MPIRQKSLVSVIAGILTVTLVTACNDKPGSAGWCEAIQAKPKGEWTRDDTKTYATHCLLESTKIGSDKWCDNLDERPKSKWTTEEVAQYGQYCVIKKVDGAE